MSPKVWQRRCLYLTVATLWSAAACPSTPTVTATGETVFSHWSPSIALDSTFVGDSVTIGATANSTKGELIGDMGVTLTSSNPAVATVTATTRTSSNGRFSVPVKPLQAGTTIITATATGVSFGAVQAVAWQETMVVSGPPVGIRLTPLGGLIPVKGSKRFQARLVDAQGRTSNRMTFEWLTRDSAIADFVNMSFLTPRHDDHIWANDTASVTGEKSGTTRIFVHPLDPADIARFPAVHDSFTVNISSVASITVTPSANVLVGGTVQLTAVVRDANGNILTDAPITWLSNNVSVVGLADLTGKVRGIASGTTSGLTQQAIITADAGNGMTATSTITVYRLPARLVVAPDLTLTIGANGTVNATLIDTDNITIIPLSATSLTWSIDQGGIASVQPVTTVPGRATVTAKATGGTQVRARTPESLEGVAQVTVNAPPPAASITIAPTSVSVLVGNTTPFTAIVKDANGATTTCPLGWAADESAIASITSAGVALGKAIGATPVRAFCTDNQLISAVVRLAVTDATGASKVTLSTRHLFLQAGQTFPVTATVLDGNGNIIIAPVTWSTSVPSAVDFGGSATFTGATATLSGVTPEVPSGVTITATSGGQKEFMWVTVGTGLGAIKGQIISASGQYVGWASATAIPSSGPLVTSQVNNEGIFYLPGLAAGTYTVSVNTSVAGTLTFTATVVARQVTLVGNSTGVINVR